MISFIYSITNTTAAITLLCLAAMPFFTALLAFLFLKENNGVSASLNYAVNKVNTKYFLQISPDIDFNFKEMKRQR